MTHDKDIDPGVVTFGLLKNSEKVTKGLNGGNLEVYYAGDEPLDTTVVVTLNGVPKKRMGLAELQYFQEKTKDFLTEKVDSGTVEILGVEVERQTLDIDVELFASESKFNQRRLQDETASIDLTTVVTGKHRPPSPGLDFNILIEDSINAEDSDFKEELMDSAVGEAGASYFETIDDIRALVVTAAPTLAPGPDVLVYKGTISADNIEQNGMSIMAIIGVVIGAAIFAFLVVFGAFVWHRRQKEKSQFEMESVDNEYDDDEESPLFHDILKRKKKKGSNQNLKRSLSRRRSTKSTINTSDLQLSDPSMHNNMPTLTTIEVSTLVDDHSHLQEPDSYTGHAPGIMSDSDNSGNATVDMPDQPRPPTIAQPPRPRRATMSFNPQPHPEFANITSDERARAASGSQLLDNQMELKPRRNSARKSTMSFSPSNEPPSPGDGLGELANTSRTSKRRNSTTRPMNTSNHSYNTQELQSMEPKPRRGSANRQFENILSNEPPSPGDGLGELANTSRTSKRRNSTTRPMNTSNHSYNTQELHSLEPKQRRGSANRQFENISSHGTSRRLSGTEF